MTNDARMEVRLPLDEKRRVFEAADAAGQVPSVYVRRVLKATLESVPGAAAGTPASRRAAGSLPPAPTPTRTPSAERVRRADVGPKPLSATKPRPKASTKGKRASSDERP